MRPVLGLMLLLWVQFVGQGKDHVGGLAGLAVAQLIRRTGASTDEGAKTTEQDFEKLAIGRVRAVVALESNAQRLLEEKFKDHLEALPLAFDVTPIYLHVNLDYHARHQAAVEQFWKRSARPAQRPLPAIPEAPQALSCACQL